MTDGQIPVRGAKRLATSQGRPGKRRATAPPASSSQVSPSTDAISLSSRTFRVRGIPSVSTKADVQSALKGHYQDESVEVTIKSLAPEAHGRTLVATISFGQTPTKLTSGRDQFQHMGTCWTIDDYFDGLTVLHCPEESAHAVDILAISGLGGHAYGSFKERGGSHMWLADSLPEHIPTARVAIYGYESSLANSTSFQNLTDLGSSFQSSIEGLQDGHRPNKTIIFIAHSLGGLIVKEAIIRISRSEDTENSAIIRSIYGAIFFGVPNDGLDIASFRAMVGNGPNRAFLESLGHHNSDILRSQRHAFSKAFGSREGPEIHSFYETCMSRTARKDECGAWTMTGDFAVLVSQSSAAHCDAQDREEYVHPLPRDHSELVKFSANSDDYDKVLRTLQKMIRRVAEHQPGLQGPRVCVYQMNETDRQCMADLYCTDPSHDKIRIEGSKGGLLKDSYCWVLSHANFVQWREDKNSRLLWIKGDPGKGKTMLLCGIIDELRPTTKMADLNATRCLSYFFCQATDDRINSGTAVLRGLIYLLVKQHPSLVSHIQKSYKDVGGKLLEGPNAWVALNEIFTGIIADPHLRGIYLIVDALDECVTDRSKLLDLITKTTAFQQVKWIVSSRNWPNIEERLGIGTQLSLELNKQSVSAAVGIYIQNKVDYLAKMKKYDPKARLAVQEHLTSNAHGTFLWVALVCHELEKIHRWNIPSKLSMFPAGLDELYLRMMDQINRSDNANVCKEILAIVSAVYRPVTTTELTSLVESLEGVTEDPKALEEIVALCGSFLTVREHTVYFVHQSAQDYLLKSFLSFFSYDIKQVHYDIFSRSLDRLSAVLRRDIYQLQHPGFPIDQVKPPEPDPLATVRYSCLYWIDHLCEGTPVTVVDDTLQDNGLVDRFLRRHYLHWLEALSLVGSISHGVLSLTKLNDLAQRTPLATLVQDQRRVVQYFRNAIETSPLQVYISTLIFSPAHSITRNLFQQEGPAWITTKPVMEEQWNSCIMTLEGHTDDINSIAFSPDSRLLASGSNDRTIKIWDVVSGAFIRTLEGHTDHIKSMTFSPDSRLLASGSYEAIKIRDVASGACVQRPVIGSAHIHLEFDLAGTHLYTNAGIIDLALDPCHRSNTSSTSPPFIARHHRNDSYTLSSDRRWIVHGTKKLLWLPPEYLPMCEAVAGPMVAIGCLSGRVLVLGFLANGPVLQQ